MIAFIIIMISLIIAGILSSMISEKLEGNSPWELSVIKHIGIELLGWATFVSFVSIAVLFLVGLEHVVVPDVEYVEGEPINIVQVSSGQDDEGEYLILDLEGKGPRKIRESETGERFDWDSIDVNDNSCQLIVHDAQFENWFSRNTFFGNISLENQYEIK